MGGFKTKRLPVRGHGGHDDSENNVVDRFPSDTVSELSAASQTQSQHSDTSKSRGSSPLKLLRASTKFAGKMKRLSSSVESESKKTMDSTNYYSDDQHDAPPSSLGGSDALDLSVRSAVTNPHDGGSLTRLLTESHSKQQNLVKNAKSRFNIGIVYMKTGDYTKALENLEQSLFAHMQLSGHDAKSYTPDTLLAVAALHEKLGDCFASSNSEVSDKHLALEHYQESHKMLSLHHSMEAGEEEEEDAHEQKRKEMLERINEKLKLPELVVQEPSPKRPVLNVNKYEMKGNDKARALLGFGTVATAVRIITPPPPVETKKKPCIIGKGIEKIHQGINEFAHDFKGGMLERSFEHAILSPDADDQSFARAMTYLDRKDHRTAFNYLKSMQTEKYMDDPDFRAKMESNMLMVASSALEVGKNSVAADAYDELHNLFVQGDRTGLNSKHIIKGCVKSHKALALEMESMMDYESAIEQRMRVKELLEEDDNFVLAWKQLLKIANLQGEKNNDYDQCTLTLAGVKKKLLERSPSLDSMPVERTNLLIQCYHMGAISFSKTNKWNEAIQQYDALLPLLAKTKGRDCPEYNASSIQKAALLVKTGHYDHALTIIIKYFDLAEKSTEKMIVDDSDHVLAMDVYTSLLLYIGNVDKAKDVLESKLTFLELHSQNDEVKSDTMHKLGCLLAFKNDHQMALPLLIEALDSRKRLFDGRHKAVFESTWAVATTSQSLGDTERSLNAYSELVSKKNVMKDMPVDIIRIHNLAGKLFFDDGNIDKSVALFRQALHEAETRQNDDQKHIAELNLANALSVRGMSNEAMELYDKIICEKTLKLSKIFFMALVNKSALLLEMGQVEEAYNILCKIEDTHSANVDDIRGRVYLLLGCVALLNEKFNEARSYFEDSLDVADDDLSSIVQAKKYISLAYMESRQYDRAISTLDDLLEDLSGQGGMQSKSVNVTKAEIWNFMAKVYKKKGNLAQAKNFAKLALQTYRAALGETHPTTLRNVSNLQVLLLEESEGLDKNEAKFFIDVAKYEIEDTLDAFESMNDPWTYRLEMVSLRVNLGFVAVWQGKPKKARKYLRQIKAVEISSGHLLLQRIVTLEDSVVQLETKRLSRNSYID